MEPRIQYAKTSDGVNIAYATYGSDEPLIFVMNPAGSHVQLEWEHGPLIKAAISFLAAERLVVRYDQRGVGLSDRDVADISLPARLRDIEAVADHMRLGSFDLVALETGGLPAIAYSAKHPERVSKLVLINCFARGRDAIETTRGQALHRIQDDWKLLTDTAGANSLGMGHEEALRYGAFIRECIDQDMWIRLDEAQQDIDLSDLLPEVRALTLIIRHSGIEWLSMDATRELAAGIPDSQLITIEGLYPDRPDRLFNAASEFLGFGVQHSTEPASRPAATPPEAGAMRTILFTDVEGSTALTDRLGDAKARDLLREHERIAREALKAHAGSEVKAMGDGFMASFSSATKALECAIAVQQAFAQRNESAEEPINVRIGLNAGEPIAEDDPGGRGDLFGTAVNMAARIAAKADAGEILASNVVRELVAGKDFLFSDRGDTELRGFEDPVRLFEVRWREE
jgi:class 3 adenylate cyclase